MKESQPAAAAAAAVVAVATTAGQSTKPSQIVSLACRGTRTAHLIHPTSDGAKRFDFSRSEYYLQRFRFENDALLEVINMKEAGEENKNESSDPGSKASPAKNEH